MEVLLQSILICAIDDHFHLSLLNRKERAREDRNPNKTITLSRVKEKLSAINPYKTDYHKALFY